MRQSYDFLEFLSETAKGMRLSLHLSAYVGDHYIGGVPTFGTWYSIHLVKEKRAVYGCTGRSLEYCSMALLADLIKASAKERRRHEVG